MKYKYLVALIFLSVLMEYFFLQKSFDLAIKTMLFQTIASWLLGLTIHVFYNKYYRSTSLIWWARIMAGMIALSLITFLLGLEV